jgi:hypothetical protein
VIIEPMTIQDTLAAGPRYALDACALAFGLSHGPTLLLSSMPPWERALRRRIGDHLFATNDPARPSSQAWGGAVWLEPPWRGWRAQLAEIRHELPRGGLLSIVLSLPLALLQQERRPLGLGMKPAGLLQLRSTLVDNGFWIERAFGFHTLVWSVARGIVQWIGQWRPDLADRLHFAIRRSFATRGLGIAMAATGLIEARAGMRP